METKEGVHIPMVAGKNATDGLPTTVDGVIEAFADGVVTVDKMLDNVDVSLDWYVPSKDAIEFIMFIRLVLGEEPENTNPKAHYFMMDCIFQKDNVRPYFMARNIDFDELKGRTVVLCSREFSKSTMVVYMILFMAAKGEMPGFGRVNYGIYVSDSMRNNVETTMTTISKVYNESKYLRGLFEHTRLIQTEVNFVRKPRTQKEIEVYDRHVNVEGQDPSTVPGRMKRTFSVTGVGAATGARGSRDGLARPDFAIFDDLISSEKEADSELVLKSIESTIESDILKALSGNGNFAIAFGTPYKKNDPIYRRIEDNSWLPVVFPRAKEINERMTELEFESVWPDRHTYKQCMKDFRVAMRSKKSGNNLPMRKLMQENYLRISNDEDRLIPDNFINWYRRADILPKLENYNLYLTTDFTTTGKSGSDFSGQAYWAVSSDMKIYLLDLKLRKMEIQEQYDNVFEMDKAFKVHNSRGADVGVETDGQQDAHVHALKKEMILRSQYFVFARQQGTPRNANVKDGISSRKEGGNKHWRFRMSLPMFQNGKIHFPEELRHTEDMIELLEELKFVSFSSFGTTHDDGCDLISQLVAIDIHYPSPEMVDEMNKVEAPKQSVRPKLSGFWKVTDEDTPYENEDW